MSLSETVRPMPQHHIRTLSPVPTKQNSMKASQGFLSHFSVQLLCNFYLQAFCNVALRYCNPHLKYSSCEKFHVKFTYFEQSLPVWEGSHNVTPRDVSPGARKWSGPPWVVPDYRRFSRSLVLLSFCPAHPNSHLQVTLTSSFTLQSRGEGQSQIYMFLHNDWQNE